MSVLQLRNHIPVGGLSTREPADGTESPFRVSLGFEPAWYLERCGTEFLEPWQRDPHYRYRMLGRMKAELKRAFPMVPYWDSSNHEATLSGVYGMGTVVQAFGMKMIYSRDAWPAPDTTRRLSVAEVEKLDPERVLQSPVVEDLARQMDLIEGEWGTIYGFPNWQGVLNNAFTLRGQELYLDLYDRPALVHHFLGVMTEVMIRLVGLVEERQRRTGFGVNLLSVSNCVMNMLSPEQYRTFVYPHDKRIAESFERFGVHTCEWDVTPYIEVLSALPKVGYLDMGKMSDLPRVRAAFPDARRAVVYSSRRLKEASLEEIRKDMELIYRGVGPCDLVMADVLAGTPDRRVHDLLAMCAKLAERPPEARAKKGAAPQRRPR